MIFVLFLLLMLTLAKFWGNRKTSKAFDFRAKARFLRINL